MPISSREEEAAALWVSRMARGLDEEDQAQLGDWLQQNPRHADALFELAEFWDELDTLSELALLFPLDQRPARRKSRRFAQGMAAAALCAALGLAFFHFARDVPEPSRSTQAVAFEQSFATAVGERATALLPDGSSVALNTNTDVFVRYQDDDRTVEMRRGEAHFTVAHDPLRPFGVRAGGHVVTAVGTAFNIRFGQEAGEIEVTVTDGVVRVAEESESPASGNANGRRTADGGTRSSAGTGLVRGQLARFDDGLTDAPGQSEILHLEPLDLENKLAWQRGVLVFEGEPLPAVLDEFGRYTTTAFALGHDKLAEVRVGGYFNAGDIDGLLLALKDNFQIRAERVAKDYILLLPDD